MKKSFFILAVLISLNSCKTDNLKESEIINGIHLGIDENNIEKEFDTLKIFSKSFYTKSQFTHISQKDDFQKEFFYTNIFNVPKYSSKETQHLGILYPEYLIGNNKLTSLAVLLNRTENALGVYNGKVYDITSSTNTSALNSNISTELIDDIFHMLENKYGQVKDSIISESINYYSIFDNEIKKNNYREFGVKRKLYIWKTKFFDVEFFPGAMDPTVYFNKQARLYHTLESDNLGISSNPNKVPCKYFCYILYSLNKKGLDKFGLDKPKL